ncbi:MAG: hypothetical protein O3A87_11145 [Verrucomicrobia bacterium]|nr:hypothetical protein [Verrucomicrobiota bacterium]MDA1007018.1 hypothetical protein [Verrucomicrobiota bacterium]
MNELIVWEPDMKLFRKLIAEGTIKGTNEPETRVDDGGKEVRNPTPGAVIDDPEGEWVKKMVAGEFGVLMAWRHPHVLGRVVKDEAGPGEGAGAGGDGTASGKGAEMR